VDDRGADAQGGDEKDEEERKNDTRAGHVVVLPG
jgi:hypothetical protein